MPLVSGSVPTVAESTPLTELEARTLTDEVRHDAEQLWLKLLRLYNGAAHLALGYGSWGDYFTAEFGGSRRRGYELLAAARVIKPVRNSALEPPTNEAQANELVPLAKDEQELVAAWREVKDTYGDKATAIDVKRVVTNRLERIKREEDANSRRLEIAEAVIDQPDDDIWIEHGPFHEVLDGRYDLDGAIVISDPPYPREFLPAWEQLAQWGLERGIARMALMTGQSIMADVIRIFANAHWLPAPDEPLTWRFRWCAAYLTEGPATRVWNANVGTKWKPILVFDTEGDDRPFVTQDVFNSSGDDKRFHYWGQNEAGFSQIVEAFSSTNDLVVDPFVGGGTTALVCRALGRRFVGCDIDMAAVNTTLERLAA